MQDETIISIVNSAYDGPGEQVLPARNIFMRVLHCDFEHSKNKSVTLRY